MTDDRAATVARLKAMQKDILDLSYTALDSDNNADAADLALAIEALEIGFDEYNPCYCPKHATKEISAEEVANPTCIRCLRVERDAALAKLREMEQACRDFLSKLTNELRQAARTEMRHRQQPMSANPFNAMQTNITGKFTKQAPPLWRAATAARLKIAQRDFESIFLRHGGDDESCREANDYGQLAADLALAIEALEQTQETALRKQLLDVINACAVAGARGGTYAVDLVNVITAERDAALARLREIETANGLPGAFGSWTTIDEFVERLHQVVASRNAHHAETERLSARLREVEQAASELVQKVRANTVPLLKDGQPTGFEGVINIEPEASKLAALLAPAPTKEQK